MIASGGKERTSYYACLGACHAGLQIYRATLLACNSGIGVRALLFLPTAVSARRKFAFDVLRNAISLHGDLSGKLRPELLVVIDAPLTCPAANTGSRKLAAESPGNM